MLKFCYCGAVRDPDKPQCDACAHARNAPPAPPGLCRPFAERRDVTGRKRVIHRIDPPRLCGSRASRAVRLLAVRRGPVSALGRNRLGEGERPWSNGCLYMTIHRGAQCGTFE